MLGSEALISSCLLQLSFLSLLFELSVRIQRLMYCRMTNNALHQHLKCVIVCLNMCYHKALEILLLR